MPIFLRWWRSSERLSERSNPPWKAGLLQLLSEGVKGSLWHFDVQLSTQPLCVSQHITTTEGGSLTGAEDERMIVPESPQELPQFWTERHSPVLRSLAVQGQQH